MKTNERGASNTSLSLSLGSLILFHLELNVHASEVDFDANSPSSYCFVAGNSAFG